MVSGSAATDRSNRPTSARATIVHLVSMVKALKHRLPIVSSFAGKRIERLQGHRHLARSGQRVLNVMADVAGDLVGLPQGQVRRDFQVNLRDEAVPQPAQA